MLLLQTKIYKKQSLSNLHFLFFVKKTVRRIQGFPDYLRFAPLNHQDPLCFITLFGTCVFYFFPVIVAQHIKPQAVRIRGNQRRQFCSKLPVLCSIQHTFEHRILNTPSIGHTLLRYTDQLPS